MNPIDAFNDTALRARRFLKLHDGLINTRQRSIRADWKAAFCRLMHWPQSSEIHRVDSRDAIIVLRDGAPLNCDDFSKDSLDDLLRASITYGVSALDRYVHERIVKSFIGAYRRERTKQQKDFQMPVTLASRHFEVNSSVTSQNFHLPLLDSVCAVWLHDFTQLRIIQSFPPNPRP